MIIDIIGKSVFYVDAKNRQVKEGTIVGVNISTTGYVLISILTENEVEIKKVNIESAHVHLTKDAAEAHLINIAPMLSEADKLTNEAKEKVDALRIDVIGIPCFIELAKKVMQ